MARKPSYTKSKVQTNKRSYSFYSKSGVEQQVPKTVVEHMVKQALGDPKKAARKRVISFQYNGMNFRIEKDSDYLKKAKTSAEELSITLLRSRQLAHDPIGYALDRAKKNIRKEHELSMKFGGILDKDVTKKFAVQQTLETTLSIVESAADFAINRYTTLQEDYLTAQAYSNVKDTINRAKQFGGSVLSGASTGMATAGPVGAVIGAVASVANFGVTQYMEYQKRMSSFYQQLNATNFQTSFSSARLGLVNNGRGTEN